MTRPEHPRCPHCGAEVSPAASACGFCGKHIGLSWLLRPILTGIIIGGALGLLAGGTLWWRAALRRSAVQPSASVQPAIDRPPALDPFYDDLLARAEEEERRGDFRMAVSLLMQAMTTRPERPAARERLEALRAKLIRDNGGMAPAASAPPTAPPPSPTEPPPARDMIPIPAGSFQMGAESPGSNPDEYPAHEVSLPAFAIEANEVTVESYRGFCAKTGRPLPRQPTGSTSLHPVVLVTWHDAQAYCRRLGRRLPTEAEWEKAARCGIPPQLYAWFIETSDGKHHAVRGKGSSGCGLFDLYGNVWEWTSDWYSATYYDTSPKKSPRGPRTGEERVMRGGAFDSPLPALSPSFRDKFSPDHGSENLGFRCVK